MPLGKFIQFMKTNMSITNTVTKVQTVSKFKCLIPITNNFSSVSQISLHFFEKSNLNVFKT